LTKFYPKKAVYKQKNLLKGSNAEEDQVVEQVHYDETEQQQSGVGGLLGNWTRKAPLVAYWHPNVTINVISDAKTAIPKRSIAPPMWKCKICSFESLKIYSGMLNSYKFCLPSTDFQLDAENSLDKTGQFGFYRPTIFPNDFWSLREHAYPVNETVRYFIVHLCIVIRQHTADSATHPCSSLPLVIQFAPLSMTKFQMYAVLDDAMKNQQSGPMGGTTASEMDEVKRMFLETNPILLGTTIFVSILHSLFEFLAFKNGKCIRVGRLNHASITGY
jgi:hypothetical protein